MHPSPSPGRANFSSQNVAVAILFVLCGYYRRWRGEGVGRNNICVLFEGEDFETDTVKDRALVCQSIVDRQRT